MQVNNAAVMYRLQKARESRLLPSTAEEAHPVHRGYAMLRHRVTQSETFGAFCRALAREWVEFGSAAASGTSDLDVTESTCKITPMFRRNAAERYNNGTRKAQRLNKSIHHSRVSFPQLTAFCVLGRCVGQMMASLRLSVKAQKQFNGVLAAVKRSALAAGVTGIPSLQLNERSLQLLTSGTLRGRCGL